MFRSSLVASCFIALSLAPTAAQQPTQAQRDALRAACRSDFMADCASVQPGGKEALECLLRNEPKLSPPCRSAVNAIATPASGGVAPAPTASTPPSDASAAAQPAAAAPPATKTPATVPTRKTTTGTHATTTATSAAAGTSASAPTAAPAVAPLGPIRPMLPRRALMILAQCRPEQQRLCAGVPAGGGKILSCLAANAQQLSPACYQALARVSE
jgi:hypothetical protein